MTPSVWAREPSGRDAYVIHTEGDRGMLARHVYGTSAWRLTSEFAIPRSHWGRCGLHREIQVTQAEKCHFPRVKI